MMCKIGSDYLDGFPDVEVERKIKLFENLDQSDGDVSFQFDVPETSKNARLLSYPVPDSTSKEVYHRIDCDLQDDSGVSLYVGFIRIERRVKREFISLSFFSGNSNWFGLIAGNLTDIDFSEFNIEQTIANIETSWSNTSGITFPLIDNGGLITRSIAHLKIEDFIGAIYVKTVFKKIFTSATIKLNGELFEDALYNKLITIKNSKSQTEIDSRSSYVLSNGVSRPADNIYYKTTYDDDSTYPYFDGSANNFDLANSQYVADQKMILRVEASFVAQTVSPMLQIIEVRVNGVTVKEKVGQSVSGAENTFSINVLIPLEPGDVVEIYTIYGLTPGSNILSATLKLTPTYLYTSYGDSVVPNWTKQAYVSAIFQLFNVITSFDPKTKTLTCNLFDKLKEKEPIDVSQYVNVEEIDYTSFISSFGKKSLFSYNEIDFDEVKDYNLANSFKYSQGVIHVDNDFISESEEIINSDFTNPFSYLNSVFDMSMERTNLISLNEGDGIDIDSVSDNAGIARINISEDLFLVGDLLRITESTNPRYNGDWVVNVQAAGYVELNGLAFESNATGKITKLDYAYNSSDEVYLMVNIPLYENVNFTGNPSILLEDVLKSAFGLAYFSLLNTNRQINIDYKQSLSFGEIQDPLFYQRTILETYWSLVSRVLNDPVKPICTGVMPANVYRSIDFLSPLLIKTLDTSNIYYSNLMSGYRSSYDPFRLELIKLP